MSAGSAWYQNEDSLIAAIRQASRRRPSTPTIPGYEDLREISSGGQGVVYLATQRSTKRQVALKLLLGGGLASAASRRRFEREVDLAASLRHANIVRLYDSGETPDGSLYFVMEYIDGVPIDALIQHDAQSGALRLPEIASTLKLFMKTADAVAFAHQNGVIHRDLKPSNVRVDASGEPHVLDFGLAKPAGDGGAFATLTFSTSGEFLGSLPWSSPEQAEGRTGEIDVRTDVYSLGVLLYQLLTGTFPYTVSGPFRAVLENISQAPPTRPRLHRPEIGDELETIVLKCLEKEPERRYQTVNELSRDIGRYLRGEPIEAKRDSAWYTLRKQVRRYRATLAGGVATLVLLTGGLVTLSVLWQRAVTAEQQAARSARQAQEINAFLVDLLSRPSAEGREARISDALLDARERLGTLEDLDPAIEADLRTTLGTSFASLGMLDEARPLLERAATLREAHLGADAPLTLQSRGHLAWITRLEGDLEAAAAQYRTLLAAQREHLGEAHRDTLMTMNDLAVVLEQRGEVEEAEQLYRTALKRCEGVCASADILNIMGNLAGVLHTRGELAGARAMMEQRLARCEQAFGPTHPTTLNARNNLAVLLFDLGERDAAMREAEAVLDGRRRALGPQHPSTLRAQANLASHLEQGGDFQRAMELYQDAYETLRATRGSTHPQTLQTQSRIATAAQLAGDAAGAERLFREVLEKQRATLTEDHPDLLRTQNDLATLLLELQRRDEARQLLADTVTGMSRTLGADSPETLQVKLNYAAVLRELGEVDEAAKIAEDVAAKRIAQLGPAHPRSCEARWELASIALERGRVDAAVTRMRSLIADLEPVLGGDHWYVAVLRGYLGKALLAAEEWDEAERVLLAAHEKLSGIFGAEHRNAGMIAARLSCLYLQRGEEELAAQYAAQCSEAMLAQTRDDLARYRR